MSATTEKKTVSFVLLGLFIATALVVGVIATPAPALSKTINLKFAYFMPTKHSLHPVFEAYAKEVEELTQKEIHKALRLKIAWDQIKAEYVSANANGSKPQVREVQRKVQAVEVDIPKKDVKQIKTMAEELLGTRGAFVLDENLNILGRVPVKELAEALQNIPEGVFAIVMDGIADQKLTNMAESKNIKYIIAKSANARLSESIGIAPTATSHFSILALSSISRSVAFPFIVTAPVFVISSSQTFLE